MKKKKTQILTSREKARRVREIASDKKAQDIVILDLRKITNICDYFVIMSCESQRKTQAVAETIEEELSKIGIKAKSVEGRSEANWIVLDYLDIIVHIFYQPKREFYNLEKLWQEARRVRLPQIKISKQ